MNQNQIETRIANLLKHLSHPTRIRILTAIGEGEACVCHLESVLGLRQAYISQHLMIMRREEILTTNREGRFIFYRLKDPQLLELLRMAAQLTGVTKELETIIELDKNAVNCCCPKCTKCNAQTVGISGNSLEHIV